MSNIHLSILLNNPANIICADSIKKIDYEGKDLSKKFNSKFDIILSNPPFGKKIISAEDNVRKNFDLAYKWTLDNGSFKKTNILQKRTSPQILFLENKVKVVYRFILNLKN
jgi:type I restriction enzyme M protein